MLWMLAAVDGSIHLIDGMTDQIIRGAKWGSDLTAVRSNCGSGTQLLVSENGSYNLGAARISRSRALILNAYLK